MVPLNLPEFKFTYKEEHGKPYIFDEMRKKYLLLTPEEWVRQNFVKYLVEHKNYPANLTALEMPFTQNNADRRCDIIVFNKQGTAMALVECKAPKVNLNQQVFDQAASYNLKLKAEIIIITNGIAHYCCKPDFQGRKWIFLDSIPDYSELTSIGID